MKYFLVIVLLSASEANAQSNYQKVNDVISYGTLFTGITFDTIESFKCANKSKCLIRQGIKDGSVILTSELIKHYYPVNRPCFPNCGIDNPMADVPSEHTALGFASINSNQFVVTMSLAVGTGIARHESNKHDWRGVAVGMLIGSAANWATNKWIH